MSEQCLDCGEFLGADDQDESTLTALFEAIAAAKYNRPGAGEVALDLFVELFPAFAGNRPGTELIATRRPADYYTIGGA